MWSGYSEQGTGSQERGPGSFAVNIPGVVQKSEGPQFVPVRAGGNMQSSGRISVPTARVDNTLGELAKLGQELIAPKIKEEQDRRFVAGMVQAASGKALQEIIDEQPAYVTIFGEAPAVEGARAYTTAARKSTWVAEQVNNMAELAKIDTAELPQVLTATMQSQLTGDEATDTLIQKELLSAMPDLIRQQTKARFVHLQSEAKAARINGFNAAFAEYDSFFKADAAVRSVDEMDRADQRLIEMMTPRPGENMDSFVDDLTTAMTQQLQAGNFSAVRFAYDNKVIDHLPQEQVNKIRTAAMRAAPVALEKVTTKLAPKLLELGRNPPATVEEYIARVNEINDEAAGLSGVPREYGELLGPGDIMRGLSAAAAQAQRGQVGALKEAQKVGTEAMMAAAFKYALENDSPVASARYAVEGRFPGIPQANAEQWNDFTNRQFFQAPTIEARAAVMRVASFQKHTGIASHIDSLWQVVNDPKATWETGGAAWKELQALYQQGNDSARNTYFGDKLAAMTAWSGLADSEAGFNTRFARARAQAAAIEGEPKKDSIQAVVRSAIEDSLTDGLSPFDGQIAVPTVDAGGKPIMVAVEANIGERERLAVESIVLGTAANIKGLNSNDQRAKMALSKALQDGLFELHGGRAVLNQDPDSAKTRPLSMLTGQPMATSGNALNELVTERVKALGGDDQQRMVFRSATDDFYVVVPSATDPNREVAARITLDEIKARLAEKGLKETARKSRATPEARAEAVRRSGRPFPTE